MLESRHSNTNNDHHLLLEKLTLKQQLNIKSPIVGANNRLNGIFHSFNPFSSEFSLDDKLINIFPSCFSFYWLDSVISQTLKHVRDMFNFNMTSNPHRYLVLFVSKTPLVVWYFIMDLIPPKVCGYFALFESKSAVIFICIHCLIISFKLRKFTRNLHGVFPSPNLNSYIVFH